MALAMPDIKVSAHALDRYMERSGMKKQTKAENRLKRMLRESVVVEPVEPVKVLGVINNGFQEALYLRSGGWILVVCDDTLATCYLAKGRLWREPAEGAR